jgi:hypothetical protein
LSHAVGRTDRQTERQATKKLIVVFRNFAKAPQRDRSTPIYGFATWFLVLRVVCRSRVCAERITGRTVWTLGDTAV